MIKNYDLLSSSINGFGKEKEKLKRPCSVDYWLKMAKRDEEIFGNIVTIDFKYSTKDKCVVMIKYTTINLKGDNKIVITLKK